MVTSCTDHCRLLQLCQLWADLYTDILCFAVGLRYCRPEVAQDVSGERPCSSTYLKYAQGLPRVCGLAALVQDEVGNSFAIEGGEDLAGSEPGCLQKVSLNCQCTALNWMLKVHPSCDLT